MQKQILVSLRDDKGERQAITSDCDRIEIRMQSYDNMGELKKELVYMPTVIEAIQALNTHNSIIHNTHVNDEKVMQEVAEIARQAICLDGEFDYSDFLNPLNEDYIIIKRPKN